MTKTNYTPGPWSRDKTTGRGIHGRGERFVCQVWDGEHGEANSHLIAAAPDLLEALQVIVNGDDRIASTLPTEWIETGRAAIAKATGGAR